MRKVMVMGGNGSLGKAMVNTFKSRNWGVLSVDLYENSAADANVIINPDEQMGAQLPNIYQQAEAYSKEYDSILCVAGGFDVSSIKDSDVVEKYLAIDKMCFQTALLTGHLGTKYLNH
mmetsp:Transcript_34652/g.53021  ORF Transcript_34652/g.53021 Transcript_34652/m.53021 type:complete len:118 (+) Transcript_34652:26-379(+)